MDMDRATWRPAGVGEVRDVGGCEVDAELARAWARGLALLVMDPNECPSTPWEENCLPALHHHPWPPRSGMPLLLRVSSSAHIPSSSFIAGGIAACGAVTVTHGFETVKIRCAPPSRPRRAAR